MQDTLHFSPAEETYVSELTGIIQSGYLSFIKEYETKISVNRFEIKNTLQPTNFTVIADTEVSAFSRFLADENNLICTERGSAAVFNGYSEHFVLSILNTLYMLLIKYSSQKPFAFLEFINKTYFTYMNTYFLAYIAEKYKQKNKEQELLYKALIKTIEKQKEEIIQKEKEVNQQKTNFIVNFAHESKTPLTILENQINMAVEEAGSRPLQNLYPAIDQVKTYRVLVDNMLDYEKNLQGKPLYNHDEIVDISKAVELKCILFKSIVEKNDLYIKSNLQNGLFSRITLPAFDRILNNIIDNAIKFNRPNGSIDITLTADDTNIFLIIHDTGYGIPPEKIEQLFKPYYQCSYIKSVKQGIGAGLSLVKGILEEASGTINIKSIFHKETTVTITLKKEIITEANKAKIVQRMKMSEPIRRMNIILRKEMHNKNKKTIFFVEDNIEEIKYLQENLTEFNIYYANNGKDALLKIETIPRPDIIISDIIMDVVDGYNFLQKLREKEEMQDIPLMFLTAKSAEADKIKGLQLGAVDYIVKPYNIPEIKEKIKAFIRDREACMKKITKELNEQVLKNITITLQETLSKGKNKLDNAFHLICEDYHIKGRQKEVLHFFLEGLDTKDIAEKLFIAENTVRKHMQKIKEIFRTEKKSQIIKLFRN